MNELSDRNVIIAIVLTILLIFAMVFSTKPKVQDLESPIQWRETSQTSANSLDI